MCRIKISLSHLLAPKTQSKQCKPLYSLCTIHRVFVQGISENHVISFLDNLLAVVCLRNIGPEVKFWSQNILPFPLTIPTSAFYYLQHIYVKITIIITSILHFAVVTFMLATHSYSRDLRVSLG